MEGGPSRTCVDGHGPRFLSPYFAEMVAEAPTDPHRFAVRQLADHPNDGFLLVHRAADGPVEWHETQVDVFFVQSGSATLVLGGKLVNGETVGPHESGTDRSLAALAERFLRETSCASRHGCRIKYYSMVRRNSIIS